jgi:hypothetical protein
VSWAGPAEVDSDGIDDTLRLLLRDLAKESVKPTIGRARVGQRTVRPRATVTVMNSAATPRLLVGLSIVYGATVAMVAVTGGNAGIVAAVGGIVVGACWALYSVLRPKRPTDS